MSCLKTADVRCEDLTGWNSVELARACGLPLSATVRAPLLGCKPHVQHASCQRIPRRITLKLRTLHNVSYSTCTHTITSLQPRTIAWNIKPSASLCLFS